MLYTPISNTAIQVAGRLLAQNTYPPNRRAAIAADLVLGRVQLVRPTVLQAAGLCRVSVRLTQAAKGNVSQKNESCAARQTILAEAWMNATDAERIDFVRRVGPDGVFDVIALAV